MNIFRTIGRWLRGLISSWSVLTRLLVGMLVVQLAILAFAVIVTSVGYRWAGLEPSNPSVETRSLMLVEAVSVAIAFGATASMAIILATTLTRRITDLTRIVEEQIATGKLDIALETIEQDEIGRLIVALNKLGRAYRASLDDLARRANEMAMLNLVAETINSTLDLQQVFDTSLREALKTVNWDMGSIYMWDERIDSLNMVSYVGLSEEVVRHTFSCQLGEGIAGVAARSRKMVIVDDMREHPEYASFYIDGMPITQISIPLVTAPGKLLGVLNIGNSNRRTLPSDELNLLTTVAHQITLAIDKAQLYHQVSQHAEELEDLVAARTAQLAKAIDELSVALQKAQEAEKLKSLLLTTVSHELRTPLATIKGSTSLLIEHHQHISGEALIQYLKDIEEETDKLTELISSLLEMSRIEAGVLQIQPQPIDLADVLRSSVNAAQLRLGDHIVHLTTENELPTCYGDARRIQQILANLLDNAAKYSPPGTPIRVHAESQGQELIVSVTDQGQGIPPEHVEHIFDRFYQVSNSRGDAGRHGIGLGLAICRGLVEAHGGRIWVESEVGRGSTFYFSLPAAGAQTLREGEEDEQKDDPHR
ncbi:MAG TPA: GAF domain-containing protein [Chloroflexi bacterium]|nr:GAF domain-containing protein [Chloroflexota bacterium]